MAPIISATAEISEPINCPIAVRTGPTGPRKPRLSRPDRPSLPARLSAHGRALLRICSICGPLVSESPIGVDVIGAHDADQGNQPDGGKGKENPRVPVCELEQVLHGGEHIARPFNAF